MEFDANYFVGETREGFYIRPMIKRAWAAQLTILQEIDIICKRHNITYYAEWGTLLGAVRHKGFIPWDDDLDIGMLREDYNRFLHYAPKELPGRLELINPYTESEYTEIVSRVVNSRCIDVNKDFLEKWHGCPYIMGVDIFPQDYIPRNKQDEEIQIKLLTATNLLAQTWNSEEVEEKDKKNCLKELQELTAISLDSTLPVSQQLYQISDKICGLYNREEADEVTLMWMLAAKPMYRLPKSCYDNIVEMPFENTSIPVPTKYDQILRLRYGENYMTPIKQWMTHDYPFFGEQEKILREAYKNKNKEMPLCFAE